ncbi:MAG: hypothetical protein OET18_12440, partial [Desulfobacterales bacterium]|nr:hypothetical protein [Desulfobacterales bacterium]
IEQTLIFDRKIDNGFASNLMYFKTCAYLPENQISTKYRYIDLKFSNIAEIIKRQRKNSTAELTVRAFSVDIRDMNYLVWDC